MTPEKYKEMVVKCGTKEELNNLIKNTSDRNQPDLAEIAKKYLIENFQYRERGAVSRTTNSFSFDEVKDKYQLHPTLSKEQVVFLANHNVPQENLFNATAMRTDAYKKKMKEIGCDIAYGTTRCDKGNHTLRTRAGHCFQCDPKKISYLIRDSSPGEVYVAESTKGQGGKIIKVGCAASKKSRIDGLNNEKYGGRSDWVLKFTARVDEMGMIESSVHRLLKVHSVTDKYYFKEGIKTSCQELFSCSLETAINTLKQLIKK